LAVVSIFLCGGKKFNQKAVADYWR